MPKSLVNEVSVMFASCYAVFHMIPSFVQILISRWTTPIPLLDDDRTRHSKDDHDTISMFGIPQREIEWILEISYAFSVCFWVSNFLEIVFKDKENEIQSDTLKLIRPHTCDKTSSGLLGGKAGR